MDKRNIINIVAGLIALFINFIIGFFLSPFIIKAMGVEAYGYINLANNFLSYFSIITIALNSMSNRFISINLFQHKDDEANKYYSSVVISNIFISLILIIPILIFCFYINKVINIPTQLIGDVKILFLLVFLNFLIGTCASILGITYIINNKLYIQSTRNMLTTFIRAGLIFILYSVLTAKIYFIAIATTIVTILTIFTDLYFKNKMTPNLKVKKSDYSFSYVKVLLLAGVWNIIGQLSSILNTGLDLLLSNILLSSVAMGVLATAKTIPLLLEQIMFSVSGTFFPNIMKSYSEKNKEGMIFQVKLSAIFTGLITNIFIAGFIGFGDSFYKLWVPSLDNKLLYVLSILTLATIVISITTVSIYSVFTAYNKIKLNALVSLSCSILNIIIVIPLVKYTNLGLYAVAGVSTIIAILRNLIFTLPYAAKIIGAKWYSFYMQVFKNVLSVLVMVLIFRIINSFFDFNGWLKFIAVCGFSGIIGFIINSIFLYNKDIYKSLLNKFKMKFRRK